MSNCCVPTVPPGSNYKAFADPVTPGLAQLWSERGLVRGGPQSDLLATDMKMAQTCGESKTSDWLHSNGLNESVSKWESGACAAVHRAFLLFAWYCSVPVVTGGAAGTRRGRRGAPSFT
jgi:hypothetical protein